MPFYHAFATANQADNTVAGGISATGATTYYGQAVSGPGNGQSIHLRWTGTPTGSFTLWASDKKNPNLTSDADWVQDTTATFTNPAGAAGSTLLDTLNSNARWRRVKYVNASGTGFIEGEIRSRGF